MGNWKLYSTLCYYLVPTRFLGPMAASKIGPLGKNQSMYFIKLKSFSTTLSSAELVSLPSVFLFLVYLTVSLRIPLT
jgi:hypothetical protein